MKSKNSQKNIFWAYALSLIILVASTVLSYLALEKLLDTTRWVDHTNVVIINLEDVVSSMKDAETGQRGYLLTNDPDFLEPYTGAKERAKAAFDSVQFLTRDNPRQQLACDTLLDLLKAKNLKLADMISQKRSGITVNADSLRSGKATMDRIRGVISRMQARELSLLVTRTAEMERYASYTPLVVVLASLIAIVLTVVFYLRIKKDHEARTRLEQELVLKDADTVRKISVIDHMANQIADGNYGLRIKDSDFGDPK
ncbi:CHASE3 domain-containing protein [Hufsiella ginkgonis]|uniref:CHASE3 domain-containing protein n=1 Tax=Hufsiella ginkgonis TaxID=2695274 RepID=A0A7K1XXT3_9SPHI|nr:CHASE3 domain-containing protein [Hufsiella ginkgonis]MXV15743.1 hypothetical protein [Hufsiella ginkgonis]